MPRLLLVSPPHSAFTPPESTIPSLGLARVASVARSCAEVRVLDMACLEADGRDSWSQLLSELEAFGPDIVGVGPLVTANVRKGEEIARLAKSYTPPPVVVVGGPDPTFAYRERLACKEIDAVYLGEAEVAFPQFVRAHMRRADWELIPNLAFRSGSEVIVTGRALLSGEQFGALSPPPWDLFDLDAYRRIAHRAGLAPYLPTEATRGCPRNCLFCACTHMFDGPVRHRPIESVADELQYNQRALGYERFVFNDDNATADVAYALGLADEVARRDVRLSLACSVSVDGQLFGEQDSLQHLRACGVREMLMGCESPHPEVIAAVRKTASPAQWTELIERAVSRCRASGIASRTNWILGLPNETKQSFMATIAYIKHLHPDTALLSLLQPYPGTELAALMERSPDEIGIYPLTRNPSHMVASSFDPVVRTRWLSEEDIVELAYRFVTALSPHFEANVSGSPYYLFELWDSGKGAPTR